MVSFRTCSSFTRTDAHCYLVFGVSFRFSGRNTWSFFSAFRTSLSIRLASWLIRNVDFSENFRIFLAFDLHCTPWASFSSFRRLLLALLWRGVRLLTSEFLARWCFVFERRIHCMWSCSFHAFTAAFDAHWLRSHRIPLHLDWFGCFGTSAMPSCLHRSDATRSTLIFARAIFNSYYFFFLLALRVLLNASFISSLASPSKTRQLRFDHFSEAVLSQIRLFHRFFPLVCSFRSLSDFFPVPVFIRFTSSFRIFFLIARSG